MYLISALALNVKPSSEKRAFHQYTSWLQQSGTGLQTRFLEQKKKKKMS